ncbi:TVP38/TMEM64 family protein [Longimicrobium sp.]|uniref:TVP38/TMEM64 family protein n=1 Tax=Longimicrobium sp. TaxID=2029185 RepID=UPI002C3D317A|nr:TVP38/TMEM64 family protein [Longimicrobium sp.]HSU13129.1 TVP38/TMEM64 family protein [Longimicrobium sp.]
MSVPAAVETDADGPAAAPPGGGRWKKLLLVATIIAIVAAFFLLGGHEYLRLGALKANRARLLDFTHRHYAAVLVGAMVAYVVLTALSIPDAVVFSLALGLLFGRWVGTAMVVGAATVGATLAFLAARYLFADAARRRMGPRMQRIARGFEEDAFGYLLFLRMVPLFPFWLVNLVPAFTPVTTRTYVAATAVGIIPGSFVFCNLGARLATIESTGDLFDRQTLLALALLGVSALVPIAWKKIRNRHSGATP